MVGSDVEEGQERDAGDNQQSDEHGEDDKDDACRGPAALTCDSRICLRFMWAHHDSYPCWRAQGADVTQAL